MALPSRQVKRARTEDDEVAPSATAGLMNIQRWVWLEVTVPHTTKRPPNVPDFNRHYIPEEIICHIPSYQNELNEERALIVGDAEPIIRDGVPRDPQIVCKAIRFLASGYLTPLSEVDTEAIATWDGLARL
ncbi:hypothetical protein Q7P36_005642 [Cladosporium allicinum]